MRLAATICDAVRREDNGKFLVIGAYTEGIVINSTHRFTPTFFMQFYDFPEGEHVISATLVSPTGLVSTGKGTLAVQVNNSRGSFIIDNLELDLTQEGIAEFTIDMEGHEKCYSETIPCMTWETHNRLVEEFESDLAT